MKLFSKIYTFLIFFFLYAPIFVLITFSFNNSKSRAIWSGFTLDWYKKLFVNTEILSAFSNTLIVAAISTILATFLGTLCAVTIIKFKRKTRHFFANVTNLPMINPEIVTGVSMMLLFVFIFSSTGFLQPGILTLIIAHTTFCLPYVVLSVMPKLRQTDKSIYEAALDLGCTPMQAFSKAILPQIMPGIITGAMMSFTMSIDDFVISYFVSGTTQTLPIAIYSMTRKIISPEINALSSVLFGTILILLIIINLRQIKQAKILRREAKK